MHGPHPTNDCKIRVPVSFYGSHLIATGNGPIRLSRIPLYSKAPFLLSEIFYLRQDEKESQFIARVFYLCKHYYPQSEND